MKKKPSPLPQESDLYRKIMEDAKTQLHKFRPGRIYATTGRGTMKRRSSNKSE